MGRELKELCHSAFKNLKHGYFYIDEGDKLATALQSYMRKKETLARIDEIKIRVIAGHDIKACELMARSDDERIEELEQELKAKEG